MGKQTLNGFNKSLGLHWCTCSEKWPKNEHLFTHPHVVPNPSNFSSVQHKRRSFEECF